MVEGPRPAAHAMPSLETAAEAVAMVIEAFGIFVIILAGVIATLGFLYDLVRRTVVRQAYHRYRTRLGSGILLGLEFLVAADIIGTVAVEPSFENLGVLALIVAIRTFLSFALSVEIHGRWPWQHEHAPPDRL